MDGILNILKPTGMTSHDVVGYIRKITGIKKVGHAGTLDPSAAGVLPIFIGKATKAVDYASSDYKTYRAEMKLGVVTDTGDIEGKIIKESDWNKYGSEEDFNANIESVLKTFLGKSKQIPPMYSAIKIKGQKLYEIARKGLEIERQPRDIEITEIKLITCSREEGIVLFDVACSKGTYIRVLCEDIGQKLGCGAFMSYLIRIKSSIFDISEAVTVEETELHYKNDHLKDKLIKVERLFENYNKYVITNNNEAKKYINGVIIDCNINSREIEKLLSVYYNDEFLGLGQVIKSGEAAKLKSKKLFC